MSDSRVYAVPESFSATSLLNKECYQRLYQQSIHEPEVFWEQQAKEFLDWYPPWGVLQRSDFTKGEVAWFEGGKLNACVNCIDRHLPARADQVAIIWEGDDPANSSNITYRELHEQVCRLASALRERGVRKGDRVSI